MMATNPDNKDYDGYGSDKAFLTGTEGMLRFVKRTPEGETDDKPKIVRVIHILQRYEWSAQMKKFDWFDVELVDDV